MNFWEAIKRLFSESATDTDPQVDLNQIQSILGYHFRNTDILSVALAHRSYAKNGAAEVSSNERLEFLGDSVLGLVIADRLYKDRPDWQEGDLTKQKARLVNETTLANIGRDIGLNRHILLSPEEDRSGGRERSSIVADVFESVIAAVYLDGGFAAARDVILRLIYTRREIIVSDISVQNYKGELLELAQAQGHGMPRYEVVSETGPDHNKQFCVSVNVAGKEAGSGTGQSKKEAEQRAAAEAILSLREEER